MVIGLEKEKEMIKEASSRKNNSNVSFVNDDITTYEIGENLNNLIASYYTIQFIHPSLRQDVINKIYQSLMWGGALFMFEKVRGSDARFQDIFNCFYQDFKILVDKDELDKEILVKVRSTGKLLKAKVEIVDLDLANVYLNESEDGISPGQACVFYNQDKFGYKVLGGGWIKN